MAVSTAIMAVSAAVSAIGAYTSAAQSQATAEYQSDVEANNAQIAKNNAQVTFEQGRSEAKTGYENKLLKRQEVAQIVGQQRAQQGASGAMVDTGSLLDLNLDTVELGERDALKMEQAGYDAQYQYDVQGYNYLNQTGAYEAEADMYSSSANSINPWLSAGTSLIGSVASNYSSFSSMTKTPTSSTNLFSGSKWV